MSNGLKVSIYLDIETRYRSENCSEPDKDGTGDCHHAFTGVIVIREQSEYG
jgi:hypothetical protein